MEQALGEQVAVGGWGSYPSTHRSRDLRCASSQVGVGLVPDPAGNQQAQGARSPRPMLASPTG